MFTYMFIKSLSKFKSEILTLETLKEKIVNANIVPKPICRDLLYIFDWRDTVTMYLADPPLSNHSFYNSFKIKMEDNRVRLRAKKLPQDSDLTLVPRTGIDLFTEEVVFEPIGPAAFRIEDINFDRIYMGLTKVVSKLSHSEMNVVFSSWGNLRHRLEALPRRSEGFKKLDLYSLPDQVREESEAVDYSQEMIEDDPDKVIRGNICPDVIVEGNVDEELKVGTDVCLYSSSKRNRPWVGRVTEILPNQKFIIHWYSRKGRGRTFHAMQNFDQSAFQTEQNFESVMFWDMSENRTETSFELSNFWLQTIKIEYDKLDEEN